jgi:hypothetical protein
MLLLVVPALQLMFLGRGHDLPQPEAQSTEN